MISLKGFPIKKELLVKVKEEIKNKSLSFKILLDESFPQSVSYVNMITKLLTQLEIPYELYNVTYTEKDFDYLKNVGDSCTIVARPLKQDEDKYLSCIKPENDVDMVSLDNIGRLYLGNLNFLPATSMAVKLIVEHYNIELTGKKVMVLGRSVSVGLPCFMYFQRKNATVTLCHSRTKREDIEKIARDSDIIVLATGKQNLIPRECFNDKQIVIDCGYNENGLGDLGFVPEDNELYAYTPVPGGVGPLTIISLVINALYLKK